MCEFSFPRNSYFGGNWEWKWSTAETIMARAAVCYAFRFFGRMIPDRPQLLQSPLYRRGLVPGTAVGHPLEEPLGTGQLLPLLSPNRSYLRLRAI